MKKWIATLLATLAAASAIAQGPWPQQPIRLIVPYAAGGSTDTLARTLADGMQPGLGQSFVIDNRPGAATNIGVQALLQARPDGYALMTAENTTLFFNEHMFSKLPYSPEKDFTYIGPIGRLPVVLAVSPAFPARNFEEFLTYVRANPDKVTYASPGIGTMHHMAMELLKDKASLKMQHVAYKGGAQAVQDVVAGHVPVMMLELTVGQQYIKSGKLRALAVASDQRIAGMPGVPTFAEAGVKDMKAYTVHGLVGPAGMPADVVARLNAELQKAVKQPRFVALMADTGFESISATPVEFRAMSRAESARWGKVVKDSGVKLD